MYKNHTLQLSLLLAALLALTIQTSQAQRLCEAIVRDALTAADANCNTLEGDQACYAYDSLTPTFYQSLDNALTSPGTSVDLPVVHTVQSSAYDEDEDEWGIGYFQVSFDDVETTATNPVRLIMMGDVLLENAVATVSGSSAGITVVVQTETVLRATPEAGGAPVANATAAQVLSGVARSADGAWVQVDLEGELLWIDAATLFPNEDIAGLAEAGAGAAATDGDEDFEPFEKLYLTTGGRSSCQEAMNDLVVQTPRDVEVELVINDVPVRMGSTVVFGQDTENGNDVMYITVIEGSATLYPDTPGEITLEQGQVTAANLTATSGAGVVAIIDPVNGIPVLDENGLPIVRRVPATLFSAPTDLTEDSEGFRSLAHYTTVGNLPVTLLNYPLDETTLVSVPTVTETVCTLTAAPGITQIAARIGPGTNRSVRIFLELDETYVPVETTTDDTGATWYGIENEQLGVLYSAATDFNADCVTTTREVRTVCLLEANPSVTQIGGYTGPADNRTIVLFLATDVPYTPVNRAVEEDGDVWFEVPYAAAGRDTLWVKGDNFQNLEGCDDPASAGTAPAATPAPTSVVPTTPTTSGDFTITLTSCVTEGSTFVETWQVTNAPAGVTGLVFVGNTETSVPSASVVTVRQTSPTLFAYALGGAGVVEPVEVFNVVCPVSEAQPTEIPPTTAPAATSIPESTAAATSDGSDSVVVTEPPPTPIPTDEPMPTEESLPEPVTTPEAGDD